MNNTSTTEKESNEDDDLDYVDPIDAAQLKPDGISSASTAAKKKCSVCLQKMFYPVPYQKWCLGQSFIM